MARVTSRPRRNLADFRDSRISRLAMTPIIGSSGYLTSYLRNRA
jgi:hypothetical protein